MRYEIVWGKHGWEVIDCMMDCAVVAKAKWYDDALQKKLELEDCWMEGDEMYPEYKQLAKA